MEINDYIDFVSIFNELIEENRTELETYKYESEHYMNILNFLDTREEIEFEINSSECFLTDESIFFVFFWEDSANRNDYFLCYEINYDRILEEFTRCEIY